MRPAPGLAAAIALLAALATLTLSPAARAEGCDQGYRPPNAAEKAFFQKAQGLLDALPAPPPGWKIAEEDKDEADAEKICKDYDAGLASGKAMLLMSMTRSYQRTDLEERAKKLAQEMSEAAAHKPSAAEQKKIAEDNAKYQEAIRKVGEAAKAGDQAAIRKYSDEAQKYGAEAQQLQQGPLIAAMKKQQELARDTKATIHLWVNESAWDSNYEHPARIAYPAAAGAWRESWPETPDSDAGTPHAWTTLLFGPWADTGAGDDPYLRLRATIPAIQGGAKIATVHVKIEAEPDTADLLLKGFRGATFKAAALPGTPVAKKKGT